MQLAAYTFGIFRQPADHPVNDGFRALNDPVFASLDRVEGLIARSGYASDDDPDSWGPEVYPRFYEERGDGWSPATLSLWRDLESVVAFTYSGLHARALARGREWFAEPMWPPFVLWWHDGAIKPQWADGAARLEDLHDHGPSARAFNLKSAFDCYGRPTTVDLARAKALMTQKPPSI